MAVLATPFYLQFFHPITGEPLANGKVYTYAAGTSTPKATYTDYTEDNQAPNPIELDAAGRCTMWISGAYKFILTDENDAFIEETDNVVSFSTPAGDADPFYQIFSGDGAETNFTLSQNMGTDSLNLDVWVDMGDGKGYNILPPNQYTLNGTALALVTAPANLANNVYVKAPSSLLGQAAIYVAQAQTYANDAENSAVSAEGFADTAEDAAIDAEDFADEAELSAAIAGNYAAALSGTSDTSTTVGTGAKVFTTEADKQWSLGQRLRVASDDGTLIMDGEVTDYTSTTLTISVDYTEGAGTHADWNISLVGPVGPEGPVGPSGGIDQLTGDVLAGPGSGSVTATIAPKAVTPTKMAGGGAPAGHVLTATGTADEVAFQAPATPSLVSQLFLIQQQLASGTDGGSVTGGSWYTRDLNTVVSNTISGASLSTNEITLPEGVYDIDAEFAFGTVLTCRVRLYNVSDSVAVSPQGINACSTGSGTSDGANSNLRMRLTVPSGGKTYRFEARTSGNAANTGNGRPISTGDVEVYANVFIEKVG